MFCEEIPQRCRRNFCSVKRLPFDGADEVVKAFALEDVGKDIFFWHEGLVV